MCMGCILTSKVYDLVFTLDRVGSSDPMRFDISRIAGILEVNICRVNAIYMASLGLYQLKMNLFISY